MNMQIPHRPNTARRTLHRGLGWASLALVAVVLAACASTAVPSVTLTVSPASATAAVGGSAVPFTATLTGSTDTVAWSLSGPGAIDNASGTTTSYTPPATGAAGSATLTATAGGQTATVAITITGPTLTITPPSATATVGGSSVTFAATLTGSTDTVAWSLSGPGAIDNATGATTSYTPPAAGGAASATLTATAGSAVASASITINAPASITVSGTVVDIFGVPQSGLAVKIGSSATNTGANGNFTLASVTTPYNAIVIDAANSTGFVFEGLTLAAPTLQLITFTGGAPANTATIATGNLSGGVGFPNPADHTASVSFGSPEAFSGPVQTAGPSYTPLDIEWAGNPSTTGALHALQWRVDPAFTPGGSSIPTDYTGYGTTALTVSNGGTFNSTATDVALSSGLGELSFSGSTTIPAGYEVLITELYTDFGLNQNLPVVFDRRGALSFSYNTPNVAGSTTTTIITAESLTGAGFSVAYATGVPSSGTAPPVSVPEVPALVLPANGATGVTLATIFDWQTFPGGLHVAVFNIGTITYVVTTSNSQTTIPNLSGEGLPLPASTAGSWLTFGVAPFLSMDAAAGPAGYALDLLKALGVFGLVAPEANGSFGETSTRTFTTAP